MHKSDEHSWKKEYSYALILGVIYIVLLGLFTWIFNLPL